MAVPFLQLLFRQLKTGIRCPWSHFSSRLNQSRSLSLSSQAKCSSPTQLGGLLLNVLQFVHVSHALQPINEPSRTDATPQLLNREEESFLQPAGCILANTFWGWPSSPQGHTADSKFNFLSIRTIHKSFSAKCFLASECIVCDVAQAYSIPGALHLSLLKFLRFLSAYSSSSLTSLWIAALPFGIPISCHPLSCWLCIPPHCPGEDTK